jgi:hypothetical protein
MLLKTFTTRDSLRYRYELRRRGNSTFDDVDDHERGEDESGAVRDGVNAERARRSNT